MNNKFNFLNISFVLLFVNSFAISPKNYSVWYFGSDAGIDFNTGIATSSPVNNFFLYDNSTVICDDYGAVYMYSNGVKLWNRNHQITPNGTGLMGNTSGGQTALIVSQPYSKLLYLFTVPEYGVSSGLRYSIIDMNADSSRGDIISKNNLLYTPSTEKIAAIYNISRKYFWIITHKLNSNEFACFKLDSLGLDSVPVISSVGASNTGGSYGSWHGAAGQMAISNRGNKIANALNYSNAIELFDFDINTGIVSNPISIPNVNHSWGVAFSPDDTKLYSTAWTNGTVWQYNISLSTQSAILASKNIVGTSTTSDPNYKAGYMQLGPDGKIYVAKFGSHYLSVINNPDSLAGSCNFVDNGFNLGTPLSQAGLTTTVIFIRTTTGIKELTNTYHALIYPNPISDYTTIEIPDLKSSFEKLEIRTWNSIGQSIKINYLKYENKIVFRKENLDPGNYFFEIRNKTDIICNSKFTVN